MTLALRTRSYTRLGTTYYRDNVYNGTRGESLWEIAPMLAALQDPGFYHLLRDDFYDINTTTTTGRWVLTGDGGAAATILDRSGGWVAIACGGNDNDEASLASIGESWLFASGKPVFFEAKIELTEANTDDANIIVGLTDAAGANALLDNGAGPAASYSGAVWFKVDGGTVWQFETSNAGTQITNTNMGAFATSTSYRVGFIFDPNDGTTGSIVPYFNGVADDAHAITLASLTEMNLLCGVKAGGGNVETLKVDYVQALAVR